jgi:hypothetical protein
MPRLQRRVTCRRNSRSCSRTLRVPRANWSDSSVVLLDIQHRSSNGSAAVLKSKIHRNSRFDNGSNWRAISVFLSGQLFLCRICSPKVACVRKVVKFVIGLVKNRTDAANLLTRARYLVCTNRNSADTSTICLPLQ